MSDSSTYPGRSSETLKKDLILEINAKKNLEKWTSEYQRKSDLSSLFWKISLLILWQFLLYHICNSRQYHGCWDQFICHDLISLLQLSLCTCVISSYLNGDQHTLWCSLQLKLLWWKKKITTYLFTTSNC